MGKLLFAIPNWNMPSEVWAQRMIEHLQDNVGLVAAYDAEDSWNEKIPAFRVQRPGKPGGFAISAIEKIRKKLSGRKTAKALLAHCRELGIDKVLFNFATMPLEMIDFVDKCNADIYVHCHGFDVAFDGRAETWPHARYHDKRYKTKLLELSKKVTFISNSKFTTANLVSIGIPPEKIRLKYFGVKSRERFVPSKGSQRPVILQLGRLVDFKGPDLTIRAFEQARSEGMDAELIVAGDGYLMLTCELLQRRSRYSDDIRILGPVSRSEASELYANADIFTIHSNKGILTNREEAFGVVVIEAMAAGLPVVAGRSGAIAESVIDGKTGILFESGDLNVQASALMKLAADVDTRNKMGKAAWQSARERFSPEMEKAQLKKILGLD